MRRTVAVIAIMVTILVLSLSSASAECKMLVWGKVVGIIQNGGLVSIELIRDGTTNTYWGGTMAWNNPTLPLYGTAMATPGVRVMITGDYGACPPSVGYGGGGTMTRVGNITASTFTNRTP